MDRLKEKFKLHTKLISVFDPLQRLINYPEQYNEQEEAEIVARFCYEWPLLAQEFLAFCLGQPNHNYTIQYNRFLIALNEIQGGVQQHKELKDLVPVGLSKAQAAIDAIPVPSTSVILEAGSPFTAYCRLRELCESDATVALTWLDAYFDKTIFHRYLSDIKVQTLVTLVTCNPTSKRDEQRWNEFLDISRLYAQERGNTSYRLVLQPSLHDRWVVFDNKRIYSLGGSVKDAGRRDYFTITAIEPSAANLQIIQNQVASGTELFGPNNPTHPLP